MENTVSDAHRAYNDGKEFLDRAEAEFGSYRDFLRAIRTGKAEFEVKRRNLRRRIDEEWINTIEECLVALDTCMRRPTKYIEQREEVLPIELSHNITSKSLQHLSQHTDYINSIDEQGNITPSKILNVFNEETLITYENKFLNTLIERLFIFVNRRYMNLKEQGDSADSMVLAYSSEFTLGNTNAKISLSLEAADRNDIETGTTSVSTRLERLNSIVTGYLGSEFCRSMGKNYIRPPVMHTNAIMKNKELRQCLNLWQFIESYEKVGYEIDVKESAEVPDEAYINELYASLALQYYQFRFRVMECEGGAEVIDSAENEAPIEPVFKTDIKDIDAEEFNVYDTEYKKVLPVSALKNRRLSDDEINIRNAVELCLAADAYIEKKRAEEIKERERRKAAKRGKRKTRR